MLGHSVNLSNTLLWRALLRPISASLGTTYYLSSAPDRVLFFWQFRLAVFQWGHFSHVCAWSYKLQNFSFSLHSFLVCSSRRTVSTASGLLSGAFGSPHTYIVPVSRNFLWTAGDSFKMGLHYNRFQARLRSPIFIFTPLASRSFSRCLSA